MNGTHSGKIVMMGQSCVGKTTFAEQIGRQCDCDYFCFDALYPWHDIEGLALSPNAAIDHVLGHLEKSDQFVVDGWITSHLYDHRLLGMEHLVVYYIGASYDRIISQYRVPVERHDQHAPMYKKWYDVDYDRFPRVRYWENTGEFEERSREEFLSLVSSQAHSL
jgi:adenylate kinase family enzyme